MTHIIDPFNDQHAIAPDGHLDQKIKLFIPGPGFDPARPTVADLTGTGLEIYGRFNTGIHIEGDS